MSWTDQGGTSPTQRACLTVIIKAHLQTSNLPKYVFTAIHYTSCTVVWTCQVCCDKAQIVLLLGQFDELAGQVFQRGVTSPSPFACSCIQLDEEPSCRVVASLQRQAVPLRELLHKA